MDIEQRLRYTSAQIERTSRNLVHCVAACPTCGWRDDGQYTAARAATKHVRMTGHAVNVDQGIVYSVRVRRHAARRWQSDVRSLRESTGRKP